jgi:hypothetical protein
MRGYYYYRNGILKIAINSLLQSWSQYIWYMESTVVSWIDQWTSQSAQVYLCWKTQMQRVNYFKSWLTMD